MKSTESEIFINYSTVTAVTAVTVLLIP